MTIHLRMSTWVHPRRSTLVLMALFALTLVVYLMVRPPAPVVVTIAPDGTRVITTPKTTPPHEPKTEITPRPTTVPPPGPATTSPTTAPGTVTTSPGPAPSSSTPPTPASTTPTPTAT